ncbi:MAG: BamA/TamA family outer membrane protein [Bryobacteraceae bacterium]
MAIARLLVTLTTGALTVFAGQGPAVDSPEDYAGRRIATIEFQPPDQPLLAEKLEEITPLAVNQILRLSEVTAAIDRLWLTGRYSDLAVRAQPVGDDAVILRFVTEPAWFISAVRARGVPEPPNRGRLENTTRLELGTRFNEEKLQTALGNLYSLLRADGFYEAVISHELQRRPATQEIDITFRVNAGPRARFATPIVTGSPGRPAGEVASMAGWERFWFLPGYKHVKQARVRRGLGRIRTAYQKDQRLMARVTLEKMHYDPASQTATPTIHVEEGPQVEITTVGAGVSKRKLRELVPVFHEQTVDRDLLLEGARNIVDYLQEQGYFRAQADFRQEALSADHMRIVYIIERGPRYRVARVEVAGNRYFDDQSIEERLSIREAGFLRFRHGLFSEQHLRQDTEAITNLYRANGFLDVEVNTIVDENYLGRSSELAVSFQIDEGPQWLVESLDLQGVRPENREAVLALLQSAPGQPFSDFNIAIDRESVLNYYHNNGYPEAEFVSSAERAAGRRRGLLRYEVREGRRQDVRDVLIGGLETTRPELVHNRILLEPGDPLSLLDMIRGQQRLYDLGVFSKVEAAVQNPEGISRNKFVQYQLEEARKYSVRVGAGAQIARIGTGRVDLTQPVGDPGFSPRLSFDVTRFNFRGLGHSIGMQARVSNLQRRGLLTYGVPHFRGNEAFNLSFTGLYDDSRDVRTFAARRREGTVQLGQRLSRANALQYRFTYRRVSVTDVQINPQLIPILTQPARIGLASVSFVQDRRDNPTDATRGIFTTLDGGLSSKVFGSQTDFFRPVVSNATYHAVGEDVTFARHVTFGWINNFGGAEIPLPERFFSGGGVSNRAFPVNQAGPRDLVTGFPIGGNAVLNFQNELRFPLILGNVRGVLFHDFGNVFSDLGSVSFRVRQRDITDFNYMIHGVGFGIRYGTPIGPLRVDLAYAINPPRFFGFQGTREQLLFCGTPNPPANINCPANLQTVQRLSHFQFHISIGQAF